MASMTPGEVRDVVRELTLSDACVDLAGRVRLPCGTVVAEVGGVGRRGWVAIGIRNVLGIPLRETAQAFWYETVGV